MEEYGRCHSRNVYIKYVIAFVTCTTVSYSNVDTNFCGLSQGYNCSIDSTCVSATNGTYTCDSTIHIGMSIDSQVIDGLIAAVQSLIDHSSKNRIIIHIMTNTTEYEDC